MSMPKLMLLRLRENAPWIGFAGLCTALMAWLGLYGFAWNDYENEARPAFEALVHGHLLSFLQLAPVYGGSLILRAPFALLTDLWGGGELAAYRMVSLPGLLACAALGIYLVTFMHARGRPALWRAIALGVCVANPLTLSALELGHPEELLGGVLCVVAVLLAYREQPLWAGLVLGVAIANKEWALLAVGPVLLALPVRRWLCLACAAVTAAVILGPLVLAGGASFTAGTSAAATPSSVIFQPWQVWWFFGHHGPIIRGSFGVIKVGYRTGPSWAGIVSHPLIIAVTLPLSALLWRAKRRQGDALLLLALLLLLRCMLDTWDIGYYSLPFIFALLTWETMTLERLPVLAALASLCGWVSFQWLPTQVSPDAQAAVFLLFSVAALSAIAMRLYAPGVYGRLFAGHHLGLFRSQTSLARTAR